MQFLVRYDCNFFLSTGEHESLKYGIITQTIRIFDVRTYESDINKAKTLKTQPAQLESPRICGKKEISSILPTVT